MKLKGNKSLRLYASSFSIHLSRYWHVVCEFFYQPRGHRPHTQKEATMAARKFSRLQATAVASLVLVAAITGCGGGGGSAPAAETPTATVQQVAVKVTSVTLTPSPSGTGSLIDLAATGTNGADGSANLTAVASWTVSMTGLSDYADSSKLSVTTAGRLQVATSATKKVDVVVPSGITSLIKAVASLNGSSASVERNVVGACASNKLTSGITCVDPVLVKVDVAPSGWRRAHFVFDGSVNASVEFNGQAGRPALQFAKLSDNFGANGGWVVTGNEFNGSGDTGTYVVLPSGSVTKVDAIDRRAEASYAFGNEGNKAAGWTVCPTDPDRFWQLPGTTLCVSNPMQFPNGSSVTTTGLNSIIAFSKMKPYVAPPN